LCRNYAGKTKKINICFCRKFIKQKLKTVGIDSGKQKNKQEVLVESKRKPEEIETLKKTQVQRTNIFGVKKIYLRKNYLQLMNK
jgi:hypothetical protein